MSNSQEKGKTLRWLLQSQRAFDREGQPIGNHKDLNESVIKENETRNILAIGQDIVSCNSGERKKIRPWAGYENHGAVKGNIHHVKPSWPLYKLLEM